MRAMERIGFSAAAGPVRETIWILALPIFAATAARCLRIRHKVARHELPATSKAWDN
jgi:hypothetical protein